MQFIYLSIITSLSATIAVVCIYFYLYTQYKERYIGLWLLSSLLHLTRMGFLNIPLQELMVLPAIIYQFSLVGSGFLLLDGTNSFLGKKTNKLWFYFITVFSFFGIIAIFYNLPFTVRALPACIQLGFFYIWTGVLFLRHLKLPGWGRYITGYSYVLMGIHILDLPFLYGIEWFMPWGLILDSILRFLVAIGTLIVYFEKTRKDLSDKELSYRLLAENALDVIYRYRFFPSGHLEFISPSVEKLVGYTPEELYNHPAKLLLSLIHPNDRPLLKMFQNYHEIMNQTQTLRVMHKNHYVVWIEQRAILIFDKNNICIGIEGIVRDITARKALEEDVSRLDRLNAVGQMAANVAHEIRNPLTTIHGYLQLFANKEEFSKYKEQLSLLLDELNRTNQIIKEYLSLSQNKAVDLKLMQINQIINTIFPLIEAHATASNKELLLALGNVPSIYLDENEIRQLILNLVRNGIEAMETGHGTLSIGTSCDPAKRELILWVKDQGKGIPTHILEKLGQPFLTTKDSGTGLGLAVCYRIANRHQAKINVETGNSGTSFYIRFRLPAAS